MIDPTELDLQEEVVVQVNRVSKVVAGGRRFRFSALVVLGDRKGHVGLGHGKATEVVSAIGKAKEDAKKNLIRVPVIRGTIPHEVTAKYGASKVLLRPAAAGTGVIAGGAVRAVMDQAGITDLLAKRFGSSNSVNVAKAALIALRRLQDPVTVAQRRNYTLAQLFGKEA